jgi:CBS domain containing-hemolysin-like protein
MDWAIIIRLGLLMFSLYLVSFFASMEASFSAVDRLALSHLASRKQEDATEALGLSEDREQLLATILLGTNLSVVLFTVTSTSLALEFAPFGAYTLTLTSLIVVLLVNIFGELIPKSRAARSPLRVALKGTRALKRVYRLVSPLSYLLVALPKRLLSADMPESDETQIRHMVEYAEEQSELPQSERDMIFGLLDSGHTPVREVMVPRINVVAADIEDDMDEILRLVRDSGFSRIPVYSESIDDIVGILYAKDLLRHLYTPAGLSSLKLKEILRPAMFIPGSKRVSELLKELRESRTHIAMVIDEYGGVEGLVTIEDLLEEIVGEIRDEYDQDEELIAITRQSDGSWLIHGRISMEDLDEELGIAPDDIDATTVAGLIFERLGRIPKKGDFIEEGSYLLRVEKMSGRQITLIRVNSLTE